jgi:pimeloyl-ACP methyl ester carboxylesterase
MRALGAALLIFVGLTASVSARTEFDVYGARGDAGHTDQCPAGQYMMGVEARTGAWFDQIAVVCGALQGDGALVRAKTLDRRGGGGGAPAESICGTNEAVSQLRSWRTDAYQIRSIELTCQNVKTGSTHVLSLRGTQTSPDAHSPPHTCKLPERGTGLVIRHGKHVNGLALVCDTRLAPAAPSYSISPGSAQQDVRLEGTLLTLFTYKPSCNNPSLLLVFHGVSRTASNYRNYAQSVADKLCMIVVAPLFDEKRFPTWAYQRGGIVHDGRVLPREQWTGRYVRIIQDWAQKAEHRSLTLSVMGHSAGAQLASRIAAFVPTAARRIVVANPSSHAFPDLATKAPYGFGGVFPRSEEEQELRRYLATPVTIFLGVDDTGDKNLDDSAEAKAQGATRIARGRNAFSKGQALARQRNWPFNWRLIELPGVGHSASKMFSSDRAIEALRP